jgi:hypothetical protein
MRDELSGNHVFRRLRERMRTIVVEQRDLVFVRTDGVLR